MHGFRVLAGDAGIIVEGCPLAAVPGEVFYRHDIGMALEEVRHKGLAHEMVLDLLLDAELLGELP